MTYWSYQNGPPPHKKCPFMAIQKAKNKFPWFLWGWKWGLQLGLFCFVYPIHILHGWSETTSLSEKIKIYECTVISKFIIMVDVILKNVLTDFHHIRVSKTNQRFWRLNSFSRYQVPQPTYLYLHLIINRLYKSANTIKLTYYKIKAWNNIG